MINKKNKYNGLTEYLEVGDTILADYNEKRHAIRTPIPVYDKSGKFIGEFPRTVILEICGFAMNPKSGLNEEWIEVKAGIVQGIINPLALVHNFKYI